MPRTGETALSSRTCLVLLLLSASLLVAPGLALAQTATWNPPAPGEGKLDWIRLVSGEWLGGEIKFMRNDVIEFDSDKLDVLQLDWEDVAELRSPRVLTYALTEKRAAIGTATLRDSVLRVLKDGETREFRREELLSIIEGAGSEMDLWSGKLSVGFVSRSGNTDQVDGNALTIVKREGNITRLDLRYTGNLGELGGVQNINNHLGSGRFDAFLSRNVFVTPLSAEFYSDKFQNIDLRTSVAAGVGFFFVKKKNLEWFIQLGGGYLSTRYGSVAAGEDLEDANASLIPVTSLEWKVVKDVDVDVSYNSNISLPDTEKLFHHFVVLLTIENLKVVDLTTSITWDHVANPKAREDGSVPDQNDLRTSIGIGIDF